MARSNCNRVLHQYQGEYFISVQIKENECLYLIFSHFYNTKKAKLKELRCRTRQDFNYSPSRITVDSRTYRHTI